jgi:GTP cyclohydrolase I
MADLDRARRAVAELLRALGHDPDRNPELAATPARTVEALHDDLLRGHRVDPSELLAAGELASGHTEGIVVVRDLAVASVCPHHLLPAHGRATVAYLPGRRLLGIGAIAELVDAFARRLTLQETIGRAVVEALLAHGGARGAMCRLELTHTCLCARGPRQAAAVVRSLTLGGELDGADGAARLRLALGQEPLA